MLSIHSPEHYMNEALKQAELAYDLGEIPVGAVVVCKNRIIAKAHNQVEQLGDATAHAEMIAFTSAANHLGSKYLNECSLFVTLEPCAMCAGASYWCQVKTLYFGAYDRKKGYTTYGKNLTHPKTEVIAGLLEKESSYLLDKFFKNLRG